MQSNFFCYHFGLEWEKHKIVRRVHAKRILQTAHHITARSALAQYKGSVSKGGTPLSGPPLIVVIAETEKNIFII